MQFCPSTTGLGLSTVYGVVKQSDGYIWADSAPGHHTTFRIYLPRTTEGPLFNKPLSGLAESLCGTEAILLVEDADSVRELVRNLLRDSGYTVLEAKCPDEAIQLTQQYSSPIHLLLSDVKGDSSVVQKCCRDLPGSLQRLWGPADT